MIREIKFRGKRIDTGKWVYGYYYSECGNTYIFEDRQKESMTRRNVVYSVKEDTIGQYTGLKDRNGKEIYEGDLLLSVGMVWKVVYHENLASFVLCTEYGRGNSPLGEMIRSFDFKIIGNIHDNPELLEEGK